MGLPQAELCTAESELGGCWRKDTRLEILRDVGLGAICWQYISFYVFSHVSQARNLETTFLLLPCQECSAHILNSINKLSSRDTWQVKWEQKPFCFFLWKSQLWPCQTAYPAAGARGLVCLQPTEDHLCDLQRLSVGSWLRATFLLIFTAAHPKGKVFPSSGFQWFYKHLNPSVQSLPAWPAKRGCFFPEQIPTDSEVWGPGVGGGAGRGQLKKVHSIIKSFSLISESYSTMFTSYTSFEKLKRLYSLHILTTKLRFGQILGDSKISWLQSWIKISL